MDSQKKELLLELCEQMAVRLQVQEVHLDELANRMIDPELVPFKRRLTLPRSFTTKLREELSFLRANIQSERITRS